MKIVFLGYLPFGDGGDVGDGDGGGGDGGGDGDDSGDDGDNAIGAIVGMEGGCVRAASIIARISSSLAQIFSNTEQMKAPRRSTIQEGSNLDN